MADAGSRSMFGAAAIVGAAVIVGSLVLARSLDRVGEHLVQTGASLEQIKVAVADAKDALGNLRAAGAAPQQRGPDPNRRYQVNIANAAVWGPENAAVTIVIFSDFQCPFCSRVTPALKQVKDAYGENVRIAFKHLPLDFHAKATPAAYAAEAARQQGKFWEMHDKIFADQAGMAPEKYAQYAKEFGLDLAKFDRDRTSAETKARIDADKREAQQLGATGTPSFFINGKYVSGAKPFEAFKEIIDAELAAKKG